MDEEDVRQILDNHSIIGLVETQVEIDGYTTLHNPRTQQNNNGHKRHGGVAVLVKDYIIKGVKEVLPRLADSIWIELNASFFGLETNVIISIFYLPPNETMKSDPLRNLREGCARNPDDTPYLVAGDLNARVGNVNQDTTAGDHFRFVDCIPDHDKENDIVTPRQLQDSNLNSYGRELIQLAQDGNLSIINGTYRDRSGGSLTCFAHPNHLTTIDLVLISESADCLWTS